MKNERKMADNKKGLRLHQSLNRVAQVQEIRGKNQGIAVSKVYWILGDFPDYTEHVE